MFLVHLLPIQNPYYPKMHLKVVLDFVKFVIFAVVYAIYLLFYVLTSTINYILMGIVCRNQMSDIRTRVRIGRILWKQKLSLFHMASPRDFICLHLYSCEVDYVLRPNVSLYCVTKDEAVFVETDPNTNVYKSEENPFLFAAQFLKGVNAIRMPITTFHSLARRLGDSSIPVMWLSNTGRCGSTLLCQVFGSVPNTLVMAEPDAIWNIHYLKQSGDVEENDFRNILRSTVRVLCKPQVGIQRVFIKPRSPCSSLMVDISEMFPEIEQWFLYRNFQETLLSWKAALQAPPYLNVLRMCADTETLFPVSFCARYMLRHHFICSLKQTKDVPLDTNFVGLFTHMLANQILVARDAVSRDQNIRPIKYEHIIASPMEKCKELFKIAEIDFKHLVIAMAAFKVDSQKGSALSHDKIGLKSYRQVAEPDRITADALLISYKLPRLGENIVL